MACVYKEYRGKIKMVQEQQLQLKIKILLAFNMKTIYQCEGMNLWWGESMGATIPDGKGMNEFLSSERGTPPIPPVQKTMLSPQKV